MRLLAVHRYLEARWALQQLYVRCALAPHEPWRIRQYLTCGDKLARLGRIDPYLAQQQMHRTLLLTALDEALPGFWRSACLETAGRRFNACPGAAAGQPLDTRTTR